MWFGSARGGNGCGKVSRLDSRSIGFRVTLELWSHTLIENRALIKESLRDKAEYIPKMERKISHWVKRRELEFYDKKWKYARNKRKCVLKKGEKRSDVCYEIKNRKLAWPNN